MTTLGTYTFLPWLREGIANRITAADGDTDVRGRAAIMVSLKLKGDPLEGNTALDQDITKNVELYGPGDIVGIDTKAILKVEPRNWITNFETNFLPYIDFYQETFPWLYTPAQPNASNINRLRPWIMLVVLAEGEFQEGRSGGNRPLPYVIVEDANVFPPSADLWAWAHVHVNEGLMNTTNDTVDGMAVDDMVIESNENGAVTAKLGQTLSHNPDRAYSRIISPRKLAPNTAYHAFLVPVFETGRLAGIGLDPASAPYATHGAWDAYPDGFPVVRPEPTHYPIYHRWYFRTSTVGDFEYLVRLLKPRPMDSRVGRRAMDVQFPDGNLPGIDDPELGGVLQIGGALQVPFSALNDTEQQEVLKYENWAQDYPHPFQEQLAAFINLAEEYSRLGAEAAHRDSHLPDPIRIDDTTDSADIDPDPLITPPLYGRWHAKMQRLLRDEAGNLLPQNTNWVHDLNLDPRFRVAAGLGTHVVQQNQESYMDAAWKQVGDILKANRQIKWAQMAKEISWIWYDAHLRPLKDRNPNRFFTLTAPVDKRVLVNGTTRFHAVTTSIVPRVAVTAPLRRMMRSRSRLIQKLNFPVDRPPEALVARINAGEVRPAPPKVTPPSLPTPGQLAEAMLPQVPGFILDGVRRIPAWLRFLIVLLISLLATLLGSAVGLIVAVIAITAFLFLERIGRQTAAADSLQEENRTPEQVDTLPQSPDFVLTQPGEDAQPSQGTADSAEAARFKVALKDTYRLIQASHQVAQEPPRRPLDLLALVAGTFQTLNPVVTIPKATLATIFIPPRIKDALFEIFDEAMAYPEFDYPMYKPLVAMSDELFLPNLQYIEQNSISLLETNQRFIEAYLVGLNHEFARELLWREYPTDQRGSYFRQFWDVSGVLDRENLDKEALREKLRDIPPIHRWSQSSNLGDHDHREVPGTTEDELVLTIRGELLKKYPTAVIYAQKADWARTGTGAIDKTQARRLISFVGDIEEANPPPDKIRTPLYEAKVDPDIYFFGFDLTAEEAKGETASNPNDAGWFFVIKERPGEPRFGLDVDQDGESGGAKQYWNDLSWADVGTADGSFLQPSTPPALTLMPPPPTAEAQDHQQHAEDRQVAWTGSVSSAEMAYILYQVPVLVAVHASEMLPD